MKKKAWGETITHEMIHCPASGGAGPSLEKGRAITIEPQMFTPAAFFLSALTLLRTPEQAGAWEVALQPGHIYLRRTREPRAEAAACPQQHEELRHNITAGSPHSLCAM